MLKYKPIFEVKLTTFNRLKNDTHKIIKTKIIVNYLQFNVVNSYILII